MSSTRIVVTGMGAVTPLGYGVETVWQRLLAGQSGLRHLPEAFTEGLAAKVGAMVPSLTEDPLAGFDPDAVSRVHYLPPSALELEIQALLLQHNRFGSFRVRCIPEAETGQCEFYRDWL